MGNAPGGFGRCVSRSDLSESGELAREDLVGLLFVDDPLLILPPGQQGLAELPCGGLGLRLVAGAKCLLRSLTRVEQVEGQSCYVEDHYLAATLQPPGVSAEELPHLPYQRPDAVQKLLALQRLVWPEMVGEYLGMQAVCAGQGEQEDGALAVAGAGLDQPTCTVDVSGSEGDQAWRIGGKQDLIGGFRVRIEVAQPPRLHDPALGG